jgi:hypothetical protein
MWQTKCHTHTKQNPVQFCIYYIILYKLEDRRFWSKMQQDLPDFHLLWIPLEMEIWYVKAVPICLQLATTERVYIRCLGAFAKLRKATIRFVMSVRLSTRSNSALTGRIFITVYISEFFENLSRKIQVLSKSDKNNGFLTWIPKYIIDHISLSSSYSEKCFW